VTTVPTGRYSSSADQNVDYALGQKGRDRDRDGQRERERE
jgi:hypothetical protein